MADFRVRGNGWASLNLHSGQIYIRECTSRVRSVAVNETRFMVSVSSVFHIGISVRTSASVSGRRMLHQSLTSPGRGLRRSQLGGLLSSHLLREFASKSSGKMGVPLDQHDG